MSDNKMTSEERRAVIQEAIDKIDLINLPPEIQDLLNYFSTLSRDKDFAENLKKEIVKKYGE